MKPLDPGRYRVLEVRPGNGADIRVRCPFCDRLWHDTVPSTAVRPVPLILTLQCPTCNLKEPHAPQA
jgi:hypothetical protein